MHNVKSASVRDIYIDYLKGLAMAMIVLLHSVQMVDGLPEIIRKPILLGRSECSCSFSVPVIL